MKYKHNRVCGVVIENVRCESRGGAPHAARWGSCPTYRRSNATRTLVFLPSSMEASRQAMERCHNSVRRLGLSVTRAEHASGKITMMTRPSVVLSSAPPDLPFTSASPASALPQSAASRRLRLPPLERGRVELEPPWPEAPRPTGPKLRGTGPSAGGRLL